MVTLGTGIGSALFVDGKLVPDTELGHLEVRGKDAEQRASESVREAKELRWKKWAKRLDEYFAGSRRCSPPTLHRRGRREQEGRQVPAALSRRHRVVPAQLLNDAGIVGAALAHVRRPRDPSD